MLLYLIFGVFAIASWFVSRRLKSKFKKYSQVPLDLTGADVAQRMLDSHGIHGVQILQTEGELTDYYDPTNRTINLSPDVYSVASVAAVAVAAHETGHACQHAQAYAPLKLRTALIPIQNISAKILNVIFIASFLLSFFLRGLFPITWALRIIIASYAVIALTSFVTLGVEIDASQRAIAWLTKSGIVRHEKRDDAIDALKWAAYTYVVAALSALATLLYYVVRYIGGRD